MREAFDIGQPRFELGQDFDDAFGIMLGAEALGNFFCIQVRALYVADGLGENIAILLGNFTCRLPRLLG